MELGLSGRVALVTGASQGIGLAIARGLAEEGVSVVMCARREEKLRAAADAISAEGGAVEAVVADVVDPAAPARLLESAMARFGPVDILINNAGKGSPVPLDRQTPDLWQSCFELNLFSAVRLSFACAETMRRSGWGRIVNISSRVGKEPDPYFAHYAAAKAGLINFTKSLSTACAKDGVTVNCVVPGLVQSEAVRQAAEKSAAAAGTTPEEVMAEMLRRRPIPVGRLGEPEDVAAMVLYLCSQAASWTTGACVTVDGGITRSP